MLWRHTSKGGMPFVEPFADDVDMEEADIMETEVSIDRNFASPEQEESIEELKEQLSAAEKREEELKTKNATKDNFIKCLQG